VEELIDHPQKNQKYQLIYSGEKSVFLGLPGNLRDVASNINYCSHEHLPARQNWALSFCKSTFQQTDPSQPLSNMSKEEGLLGDSKQASSCVGINPADLFRKISYLVKNILSPQK